MRNQVKKVKIAVAVAAISFTGVAIVMAHRQANVEPLPAVPVVQYPSQNAKPMGWTSPARQNTQVQLAQYEEVVDPSPTIALPADTTIELKPAEDDSPSQLVPSASTTVTNPNAAAPLEQMPIEPTQYQQLPQQQSRFGSQYEQAQPIHGQQQQQATPSQFPSYTQQQRPSNYAQQNNSYGQPSTPRHTGDSYTVRPNDSLWTISNKIYGSGRYFKALAHHNADKHPAPDRLKLGDVIRTPSVDELHRLYPRLCPKRRRQTAGRARVHSVGTQGDQTAAREYVVKKGDTLFDIARFEMGDGSRWVEIYEYNQGTLTDDIDYLPPGTKLVLPPRKRQPQQQQDVLTRDPRQNDIRR